MGSNLNDFPGDVSTKTAGLTTGKVIFKSNLSTPSTEFMTMDFKDFYINNQMDHYKYMMNPQSPSSPTLKPSSSSTIFWSRCPQQLSSCQDLLGHHKLTE
jgi:hypothetical protein